jgi:arylsulfatase A-like enzyme
MTKATGEHGFARTGSGACWRVALMLGLQATFGALAWTCIDGAMRRGQSGTAPGWVPTWGTACLGQLLVVVLALAGRIPGRTSRARVLVLAGASAAAGAWLALELTSGQWISTQPVRHALRVVVVVGAVLAGISFVEPAGVREGRGRELAKTVGWAMGCVASAVAGATVLRGGYPAFHVACWVLASICAFHVSRPVASRLVASTSVRTATAWCFLPPFALLPGLVLAAMGERVTFGRPPLPTWLRGNAESAIVAELGRLARGEEATYELPPVAAPRSRPKSRRVLLILVDTLRADVIDLATRTDETAVRAGTPFLRSLRRRSLTFSAAYAPAPFTHLSLPATFHSSEKFRLDLDEVRNLAGHLRVRGVATEAVVWDWMLIATDELAPYRAMTMRGFSDVASYRYATQSDAFTTMLERMRVDRSEKRFAWLHVACMHEPGFDGAILSRTAPLRSRYASSLRWLDGELARFFEGLERDPRWNDALVILTSDHGEGLGDHDADHHGETTFDEQVRVPLWFTGAGVKAGEDASPAGLIDLAPTIASTLDVEAAASWDGLDLFAPRPHRFLFSEAIRGTESALSDGRGKLVYRRDERTFAYYDLVADPHELNPLDPAASRASRRLLWEAIARTPHDFARYGASEHARDALAAVGTLPAAAEASRMVDALRSEWSSPR